MKKLWVLLLSVCIGLGTLVAQDAQDIDTFKQRAQKGDAKAQYLLGGMYAYGLGVPEDYVLAHAWLNLAAAQGFADGTKLRDLVAKRMTPQQIAQAQELARNWKPKK